MLLHLFKKTYVELDLHVERNFDRVVISQTNGFGMMELLDKVSSGTLFSYGNQLSDLVGAEKQFPTFYDFIKFCSDHNDKTDRKLIIYCDKEAVSELLSVWFKTIFVDINSASAYKIIYAAFAKKILFTRSTMGIAGLNEDYEANLISENEFKFAFDKATTEQSDTTKIMEIIENCRSVEYMVASYFYNESFKDKLTVTVRQMINRHVRDALKEAWLVIQRCIMRSTFQETLGLRTYTLDNLLNIRSEPNLSAFITSQIWKDQDRTLTSRPALDLRSLTGPELAQIKMNLEGLTETYYASPSKARLNFYMDKLLLPVFTDQDLKEVLDFEFVATDQSNFWTITDQGVINLYFLDHVFEAKRNNTTEQLRPYLLRV